MRINADFSERVVIRPGDTDWVPSPMPGVDRLMLDRIGDEVARATSIVRYAPNSYFDPHVHGGGEEFLVLEGTFSDEHGDYPAGTYVRNPIGSHHKPHSKNGTTIFVKLHQFDNEDTEQKVIRPEDRFDESDATNNVSQAKLHEFGSERVRLVNIPQGSTLGIAEDEGGAELLVLKGELLDDQGTYPKGTWIRLPSGECGNLTAFRESLVYVKTGHLVAVAGVS